MFPELSRNGPQGQMLPRGDRRDVKMIIIVQFHCANFLPLRLVFKIERIRLFSHSDQPTIYNITITIFLLT